MMRQKHPAGAFKKSAAEPRLMLPREPDDDDDDGEYYRLLPEGEYLDYDGFTQGIGSRWGFDANRQFPSAYRPEGEQGGAGQHHPPPGRVAKLNPDCPDWPQSDPIYQDKLTETYTELLPH